MVCPFCGQSSSLASGRCTACGAAFARTAIVTGVVPFDTTGLPPGATFGATINGTTGQPGDPFGGTTSLGTAAPTGGDTPPIPTAGPPEGGPGLRPRYPPLQPLRARRPG